MERLDHPIILRAPKRIFCYRLMDLGLEWHLIELGWELAESREGEEFIFSLDSIQTDPDPVEPMG